MAAQIMIELVPDTSKVKGAIDQIEAGGTGDADEFKKGNAEIEKRNKLLAQTLAAEQKIDQQEKQHLVTIGQVTKAIAGMSDGLLRTTLTGFQKGLEASGKSAAEYAKSLKIVTQEEEKQVKATMSLRAEKKKLADQIGLMILNGQKESALFQELLDRSGDLDDAMADAADAIKRTGSDTRGLDNLLLGMRGVAAGFSVVQGAAALFGDENEDVQKALLKVNAAMSVLNGLQEIQNLLKSEYVKTLIASITATISNTTATVAETAAVTAQETATEGATVAQIGLNTAMKANPIGLIVAAIAAVVTAIGIFTSVVGDAEDAQNEFNKSLDTSATNDYIDSLGKALQLQLAILKLHDATSVQLAEATLNAVKEQQSQAFSEYMRLKQIYDRTIREDESKKNKEAARTAMDEQKKLWLDLSRQAELQDVAVQQAKKDALEKQNEDAKKAGEKQAADAKQLSEKQQREKEKRDADAKKKREDDLKAQHDALVKQAQDAKALADLQLLNTKKGSEAELKAKEEAILKDAALELTQEGLTQNQIKLIHAKALAEIAALEDAYLKAQTDKQIAAAQEWMDAVTEADRNRLERELNNAKLTEKQRFQIRQDQLNSALITIQSEQQLNEQKFKQGLITEEQYLTKKIELNDKYLATKADKDNEAAERDAAIRDAAIQASFQVAQQVADTFFEIGKQKRDAELNDQLTALDKEKEAALKTKNLTEAQKEQIQKKYDKQAAQLKTEAAKKDRKAQIGQAFVNTALAVTNALATVQPFWAALIAAGVAAAAGALQIVKITQTPLPQYAKGGENVPAGYAWVGEEGPEIIKLKGGESIYTASQSEKMAHDWSMPDHSPEIAYNRSSSGQNINYEELGRALAKYLPEAKNVSMIADEYGLSMFIEQRNAKTIIRNKRYSTS